MEKTSHKRHSKKAVKGQSTKSEPVKAAVIAKTAATTKRCSTKQLLTPKQVRFLEELPRADTQAQAALSAGYKTNNPNQTASNVLARIIRKAPEVLERCGLDLETLVNKRLLPALGAKETKFFAWEGEVTDSRDVVAWDARLKSLDMAFRLHGAYQKNGNGNGHDQDSAGNITINLVVADAGRAQAIKGSISTRGTDH